MKIAILGRRAAPADKVIKDANCLEGVSMSSEMPSGSPPSSTSLYHQPPIFVFLGIRETPDLIEVVGECPEGHSLWYHLNGRHLNATIRRTEAATVATEIYYHFWLPTEGTMMRDITVENGKIFGVIRRVQNM